MCQRGYGVSNNGYHVIGLYASCSQDTSTIAHGSIGKEQKELNEIGKVHVELKNLQMSGLGDPLSSLQLEYLDSYISSSHDHPFTFSPDLSVLRVGPQIFDLMAPSKSPFSFPDSPLTDLDYRIRISSLSFSACNRFMFITYWDNQTSLTSTEVQVFKISHTDREIQKIFIPGISDVVANHCSANFHPSFPILTVTYTTEEAEPYSLSGLKMFEVDVEASRCLPIGNPRLSPKDRER